ncbi:MAG: GIY-YIG nuclease family protein, partial [Pseudomonadales bacterium]
MSYWVYIITNQNHSTLYIGVTNNLLRRINEHKNGDIRGFSAKYRLKKLIYAEETNDVMSAIEREKQIKRWRREKKV